MDINIIGNGSIEIVGAIKTMDDYKDIKEKIQALIDGGSVGGLDIRITDSFSITSSVIGYFLKVVNKDEVPITLHVKDSRLYNIFEDLSLLEAFNVKKI